MSKEEQGKGQGRYCCLYQPRGFASSPQFIASVTLDCFFNCPWFPSAKMKTAIVPMLPRAAVSYACHIESLSLSASGS